MVLLYWALFLPLYHCHYHYHYHCHYHYHYHYYYHYYYYYGISKREAPISGLGPDQGR